MTLLSVNYVLTTGYMLSMFPRQISLAPVSACISPIISSDTIATDGR